MFQEFSNKIVFVLQQCSKYHFYSYKKGGKNKDCEDLIFGVNSFILDCNTAGLTRRRQTAARIGGIIAERTARRRVGEGCYITITTTAVFSADPR